MDFERRLFSLVVWLSSSPSFRRAAAAYRRAEAWWCTNLFHCTA
ncbi:MAG: hypothetical protein NTV61_10530 [Candidatus Bathyarchaeota archaeon]|nr:hypothetical protein [Candidatus Bathyarchaeota archaeon]